uniref:Small ribosomal subunit protein mS23 n=1 Tax=Gallus gallus TaxID=9031 RepID=A0A8V1AP03_CHICK
MAGSRMQKTGSVFSRTRNLLRIGVIQKPLWFDVYATFPPLREPLYRVPRPRYGKVTDDVPPIFYREDEVRAKFYRIYGSGPKPFDLSQPNYKSTCQSTTGSSGCGSQGFCTTSATSNRVGRVAGEEGKSGGADARTERNTEGKSFILTAVLLSWHILQLGIVCPWYSSAQEPACPSAQPGGSKK